ncbi:MAG: hypothetical protein GC172_03100 [Phycisphaera sp.]|nr:hypothetical protein [Phycisphaera sp.]
MTRRGPSDADAAPPLPRWKRALFTLVTLAIPLVALGAVEVALRIAGFGGYPAFIRDAGEVAPGRRLMVVEPAATKPYFFANPDRPGYAEESHFESPKPAGTMRVFLVGESAAKGYPQPRNLAISAFLERDLNALLEGDAAPAGITRVEVINLGTTAVASFPLVAMVDEIARHEPDAVVFFVGNNEFFGAYGTASINSSGSLPTALLPWMRAARGLALVQALDGLFAGGGEDRTLMEEMIGQVSIPAESPLRAQAAANLRAHLSRMIATAEAAGARAIVCTTPSNESGLAPIGEGGGADARFAEARQLAANGRRDEARAAFLDARDLDTMPWRPTRATEEAIREAAREHGATLCDVAESFRAASADGATGWDLMDDHVHLTVKGQATAARLIAAAIAAEGPLAAVAQRMAELPSWDMSASALGANPYDDYRVHHTMRVLFRIPFMKRSNPEALARFEALVAEAEARMRPSVREVARDWQTERPHAGGLRPLAGMVARVLLREGETAEAARLYGIARRQVPDYTSWSLEYTYFELACRERLTGALDDAARAEALAAIERGRFLLSFGHSDSGFTERYIGRLCQLRGEWAEAIPFLVAARPKMSAEDLVACDQALVMSYIKCGRAGEAAVLIDQGIRGSGRFAPLYERMREELLRGTR